VSDPFFFEHDGTRLFGVTAAAEAPATGTVVVLCHPYAEEKQLTDRVLVRFARHLAAAGYGTLRFDCLGYGESAGHLGDGRLDTQVSEALAAVAVARERLAAARVVLLGLRLGGTVAALAAERDSGVAGLVLWSPVLAGRTYVRELLRKKLAAQLALQDGTSTREELIEIIRREGRLEFEGGFLTAPMFDDLSAIDLSRQVTRFAGPVQVATIRQRSENYGPSEMLATAYRTAGATCDVAIAGDREYWDVKSMFDGVFPEELFAASLEWMRGHWPRAS